MGRTPLSLPSRSEGFQVGLTDKVSAALWNAVFLAICGELDELTALKADVEATVTAVANGNLDTVLQGQLATRLASTTIAFDELQTAIASARDQLVAIQAGVVLAQSVTVAEGWLVDETTSAQQAFDLIGARLGEVRSDLEAIQADRFAYRGTYDETKPYALGDVVKFGTGLYRAAATAAIGLAPNNAPSLWTTILPPPVDVPNVARLQRTARILQAERFI